MSLFKNIAVTRPLNSVAAGTSNQTSSAVDMQGYDGCVFIAHLGTLTATQVTSLKVQSSTDDGSTDAYADITGSATSAAADADSNKMLIVDVFRPAERYLKAVVVRGTANAVIDGVTAIRYRGRKAPISQSSTFVSQSASVYGA